MRLTCQYTAIMLALVYSCYTPYSLLVSIQNQLAFPLGVDRFPVLRPDSRGVIPTCAEKFAPFGAIRQRAHVQLVAHQAASRL